MIFLMLDTCIWWNLAVDQKEKRVLSTLSKLVHEDKIRVVVPDVISAELDRNKPEIRSRHQMTHLSHLRICRDLFSLYKFNDRIEAQLLKDLEDEINKLPNDIETSLLEIESIFSNGNTVKVVMSDDNIKEAVNRSIDKLAPFHKSKNSVPDAIIAGEFRFTSTILLREGASNVIFVTDNKSDFSDTKIPTKCHPDLEDCFAYDPRIKYSINIADTLNYIEANSLPTEIVDHVTAHTSYRDFFCSKGGNHEMEDYGWIRTPYTGMSWHKICKKCGLFYDTGETFDD